MVGRVLTNNRLLLPSRDVHFNPWFSSKDPFVYYQTTYGRAFVMGRSDWEYVFNTFAFAYAVGYHFIERATGSMNGNFLGIGCGQPLVARHHPSTCFVG